MPPAAVLPPTPFEEMLTAVLRLNANQVKCLKDEDFTALEDLRNFSPKEVTEWTKQKDGKTDNRGGCRWGLPKVKNLQALAYWVTDSFRRGLQIVPPDFTPQVLESYKELVRVEGDPKKSDTDTELPPVLKDHKWEEWCILLQNYLMSKTGINSIPLYYVIREDLAPGTTLADLDRDSQLIHAAPLTGPAFVADTKAVYQILNQLTVEQNAAHWITAATKRKQDGRAAMKSLRDHYDGPDGKLKRKTYATAQLEVLHYKHEQQMTFQTFASKLKKAFDTIKECDPPGISNSSQVELLLKKIQTSNISLTAVISNIRMNPARFSTFTLASMEIATQIAIIFPSKALGGGHRLRKRDIAAVDGDRDRGGGKGFKIVKKDGKQFVNNVDVTDRAREFPAHEWKKLPRSFRTVLNKDPSRQSLNKKYGTRRNTSAAETGASGGRSVSFSDQQQGNIITGVARAVISGVTAASLAPPATVEVRQPRMGAGGAAHASRQRQTASAQTQQGGSADDQSMTSRLSTTTWDHHGNIIN